MLTLACDGPVFGLAFAPDGRHLAVGAGGRVQLWDALAQARLFEWPAAAKSSHAVRFDPAGTHLYAVADEHHLIAYDARTGLPAVTYGGHGITFPADCLSADGQWVIGFSGRALYGWRVGHDGQWERSLEAFGVPDGVQSPLAFSPAVPRMALGLYGSVAVYNPTTGQRVAVAVHDAEFGHFAGRLRLAFHPTDYTFACADSRYLALYEAETGNLAARTDMGEPVAALSFTPDGQTLYAAVGGGRVRRWYVPPPVERTAWNWWESYAVEERQGWDWGRHLGDLTALALSPDGTTAAAADAGGTVLVWDLEDGD